MKETSRRDNKYRSGSTLCRGSKERHTRWQINTPFPVASRGALNSNVRRMTPRSVCALNAPPTRFACSHYVGARWSEQYTWDCFALTSLHLLVSHMGHEMGLQVSWLWGLRELLHLWSGNWNDKDLKFLIWICLKKKKRKEKQTDFSYYFSLHRLESIVIPAIFFTDHDALHVLYFLTAYVTSSITGENIIYSLPRNCTGGSA